MVDAEREDQTSAASLAIRMIFYYFAFLALVLIGLPMLFDYIGKLVVTHGEGTPFLDPGLMQRIVGGIIGIGSLIGYTICSLWLVIFGKGPFVEFDPPRQFVANGPYRWVRNPVVLFLLTTILGEAIYFGSFGILVLLLLGIPFAQFQATRIEEPRLTKRFGQSYTDYCRRVPRWVPRPPRDDPAASA
ncbi:MAG: methyltransferase family protein [Phycisphaerae bacterium]